MGRGAATRGPMKTRDIRSVSELRKFARRLECVPDGVCARSSATRCAATMERVYHFPPASKVTGPIPNASFRWGSRRSKRPGHALLTPCPRRGAEDPVLQRATHAGAMDRRRSVFLLCADLTSIGRVGVGRSFASNCSHLDVSGATHPPEKVGPSPYLDVARFRARAMQDLDGEHDG